MRRQARQIKYGGINLLWKKITMALSSLPFLPVAILIKLLQPFIVIRIGRLITERIGHLAGNTEVYLCERDAGINVPQKPFVDILYHMPTVCNEQLKKMWDRSLKYVVPLNLLMLERLNRWLSYSKTYLTVMPNHDRDIYGLLGVTKPHLSFTDDEEQLGQEKLQCLGIAEGDSFVCFHARDPAYLRVIHPGIDTSYHDYRDSNIENYLMAAEELARRGYYAVRMGAVVSKKVNTTNPRIIDYAASGLRSDFMDIYLGAKCSFFISSGTGIDAVPMIFRRLSMFVNFLPLEYGRYWQEGHLFIPKKHWLQKEKRLMTFKEIFDSGAGRFLHSKQFEAQGIELIENTPEEIAMLSIEMDERLNGTWKTNDEDEELQARFWTLFKPSELNGIFRARIGTEFLRAHRDLL